jgi:putative transposase
MSAGRPLSLLELSADEAAQLQSPAESRTLPHSIVQRAQFVLACAAGNTNTVVAKRFGVSGSTVDKWRQRYLDLGVWCQESIEPLAMANPACGEPLH